MFTSLYGHNTQLPCVVALKLDILVPPALRSPCLMPSRHTKSFFSFSLLHQVAVDLLHYWITHLFLCHLSCSEHDGKCNDIFTFDLNNLISPILNPAYIYSIYNLPSLSFFLSFVFSIHFPFHFHHQHYFLFRKFSSTSLVRVIFYSLSLSLLPKASQFQTVNRVCVCVYMRKRFCIFVYQKISFKTFIELMLELMMPSLLLFTFLGYSMKFSFYFTLKLRKSNNIAA